MVISTPSFLKEYRDLVKSHAEYKGDYKGAAKFLGVSATMVRNVYTAQALPGPKILKEMGLEPVKEIKYRYRRVD